MSPRPRRRALLTPSSVVFARVRLARTDDAATLDAGRGGAEEASC